MKTMSTIHGHFEHVQMVTTNESTIRKQEEKHPIKIRPLHKTNSKKKRKTKPLNPYPDEVGKTRPISLTSSPDRRPEPPPPAAARRSEKGEREREALERKKEKRKRFGREVTGDEK
ncbi:hypothetical protein Dimus_038740 [Dionaea muscipula]